MIRTAAELAEVCGTLRTGGVAALDTEFVWRNTYKPMLALIRLGAADGTRWLEDCLQGVSPQPLAELIEDPHTVKILHDAHQDLEHLYHYTGAKPVNVFDTQLAAAFAGLPAGLSLQKLVAEIVGITLSKTETVTDWTRRPLTDAQVAYALDDVRYLGEVRAALLERAEKLGTRAWLEEDMQRYADPTRYGEPDPEEIWKRVKCGRVRLDGRGFAVLRELAATREAYARTWNLPKPWLADDLSLAEMAAAQTTASARLRFRHRLSNRGQRDLLAGYFAAAVRKASGQAVDKRSAAALSARGSRRGRCGAGVPADARRGDPCGRGHDCEPRHGDGVGGQSGGCVESPRERLAVRDGGPRDRGAFSGVSAKKEEANDGKRRIGCGAGRGDPCPRARRRIHEDRADGAPQR